LNSRLSLHPRWEHSADSALSGFYIATVSVVNPHTENYGGDYDPYTNSATGGQGVVLWTGKGQLQQFRSTLNAIAPVGAYTEIQSVRFTAARDEVDIPVRKGYRLLVVSCPKRPQLQSFQFTIVSGLESALAFSRDIEAEADQGVILGN
jgi:hypothetical protein